MQGLTDVPPAIAPVLELIAPALASVERVFDDHLASDLPPVAQLVRHVERYRGKMLRPTLCLVAGLASHPDLLRTPPSRWTDLLSHDHAVAAAVCEMVHMATLVHDDVLDEADVRRRGTTVNRLRGNEAAVILGDYLIAGAYRLCASINAIEPSRIVGAASMVMCTGELLQLHHRENFSLDQETYFEIVARKTAALIAASAELGAVCSRASEAHRAALRAFGEHIGVAFQIQDDVLDLTGNEASVGKSVGKDIEKGKLTLPMIHHLETASAKVRGRSLLMLDDAGAHAGQGIEPDLLRALESTGSINFATGEARRRVQSAHQSLHSLPDSPARQTLSHFAHSVVSRTY